jgi:hypothetical protein
MLLFDVNWLLDELKRTTSALTGVGLPPVQLPIVFQLVSVAPVHVSVAARALVVANKPTTTMEAANVARTNVVRSMFDLLTESLIEVDDSRRQAR